MNAIGFTSGSTTNSTTTQTKQADAQKAAAPDPEPVDTVELSGASTLNDPDNPYLTDSGGTGAAGGGVGTTAKGETSQGSGSVGTVGGPGSVQKSAAPEGSPHDNALNTEIREDYQALDQEADDAFVEGRQHAERGVGEHRLEDGSTVTVAEAGEDGTQRVVVEGADGTSRTIEYRGDDYLMTNDGSRTLVRDGEDITETRAVGGLNGLSQTTYRPGTVEGPWYGDDVELTRTRTTVNPSTRSSSQTTDQVLAYGATISTDSAGRQTMVEPNLEETDFEREYKAQLLEKWQIQPEAAEYLRDEVPLIIEDPSAEGGGGWSHDGWVSVNGTQEEAILHEFSHEWYNEAWRDEFFDVQGQPTAEGREFQAAVARLADDPDADPHLREIATFFTDGTHPDGRQEDEAAVRVLNLNYTEMFASLASGSEADLDAFPDYLRPYFDDYFVSR